MQIIKLQLKTNLYGAIKSRGFRGAIRNLTLLTNIFCMYSILFRLNRLLVYKLAWSLTVTAWLTCTHCIVYCQYNTTTV